MTYDELIKRLAGRLEKKRNGRLVPIEKIKIKLKRGDYALLNEITPPKSNEPKWSMSAAGTAHLRLNGDIFDFDFEKIESVQ